MSAQDKTEQVVRELLLLFAKSEVYDPETNRIIVDKKKVLELLNRLTHCIYEIMDEHELTKQSRDKAEREAKKRGEKIVWDASRKAEDVYAASVMYTNEALQRVQQIMQKATDSVREVYDKMDEELKKQQEYVRSDQFDLKGHLEDLVDTDKYLKLIEERNKQIKKEQEKEKHAGEPSPYAGVKPEIRVNAEYFEKAGIPLEEEAGEQEEQNEETPKEAVQAEVNVNLDAEYFKWKEGENEKTEKKPEKNSGFLRKFFE